MFHKDFFSIRIFFVYICFVFNVIRVDIFVLKTSFIFFQLWIFNVVPEIFVLLLKTTSFERFAIM